MIASNVREVKTRRPYIGRETSPVSRVPVLRGKESTIPKFCYDSTKNLLFNFCQNSQIVWGRSQWRRDITGYCYQGVLFSAFWPACFDVLRWLRQVKHFERKASSGTGRDTHPIRFSHSKSYIPNTDSIT